MLRLICLIISLILILSGEKPEIHSVSLNYSLSGDTLKLSLDPIIIFYPDNFDFLEKIGGFQIGGFAIGNIVAIKERYKDNEAILEHELNHVKQYQALGDLFFLAGLLGVNLEGYPYYVTGPLEECNKAMWKPPDWWFFRWHFLELEFKLPNPIL